MYNYDNIDKFLKQAALEEDMLISFIYPMKDIIINKVINPILNGEINETNLPPINFITNADYNVLINQIINDFIKNGKTRQQAINALRSMNLKQFILNKFKSLLKYLLIQYKLNTAQNTIYNTYVQSIEQELENIR
jgi:hypothetical protein